MKNRRNSKLLIISILIVFSGPFLLLVNAYTICDCGHSTCTGNIETCPCCGFGAPPPPPPQSFYYPNSYTVDPGELYSGNLDSLKYNDGNVFRVKTDWDFIWFPFILVFFAVVRLDFTNREADLLKIELSDIVDGTNFYGYIHYTTGESQSISPIPGYPTLEDGQHTFTLDTSRIFDYVTIWYYHHGSWGDKFLMIDYAYLVKDN